MGSENIFDNLKPLRDELGLGRDMLVEVCKKLKINFLNTQWKMAMKAFLLVFGLGKQSL